MVNIVLIDDDPIVESLLEDYVEILGYNLATTSGSEGSVKDFLADRPCDILLLDGLLQDRSGFEVLKEIQDRDFPVVMITANPNIRSQSSVYGVEPDDYLTKPFDVASFKATIAATIHSYRVKNPKP